MEIKNNLQSEILNKLGAKSDVRVDHVSKEANLEKITQNNSRNEIVVKTNTDKIVVVSSNSSFKNDSKIKVGDKIKFSDNIEVEVIKKNKETSPVIRGLAATGMAFAGVAISSGIANRLVVKDIALASKVGLALSTLSVAAGAYYFFKKPLNGTKELDKESLQKIVIKSPQNTPDTRIIEQKQKNTNKVNVENTKSIYGNNITVENAKQWLTNNPEQVQNPKLLSIADYENDGKISPENLSQAANAGTVVLNGIKSFYLPDEKISEKDKSQIEYNKSAKREMDAQEQKRKAEAVGAAVGLTLLLGGAVVNEVGKTLR